jgi:pimeloyl-ACP methyl ester carboxylesterase
MRKIFGLFPATIVLAMFTFLSAPAVADSPGPLAGKSFGNGTKALVVVLHGDVSRGGAANYHYKIASQIASRNKNVTVLGLVRPGYSDGQGRKSPGSHNNRRDHYTSQNNKLVAQTIQAMAKQVGTNKIIAMGHSGGAAQLGTIAGTYPGLLDSVVLVSCPCNIDEWRTTRGRSAWSNSQSPHKYVGKIGRGTRVIAVTGTRDDNTFPKLAQDYIAAARARGLAATFVPVNGASHDFSGSLASKALAVMLSELK